MSTQDTIAIECTSAQFDTILAALRCYQKTLDLYEGDETEFHEIATNSGEHVALTADDIDAWLNECPECWHMAVSP